MTREGLERAGMIHTGVCFQDKRGKSFCLMCKLKLTGIYIGSWDFKCKDGESSDRW